MELKTLVRGPGEVVTVEAGTPTEDWYLANGYKPGKAPKVEAPAPAETAPPVATSTEPPADHDAPPPVAAPKKKGK